MHDQRRSTGLGRRAFLRSAAGAGAAALLGPAWAGAAAARSPHPGQGLPLPGEPGGQSFVTRPDLRPPAIEVNTPAGSRTASGLLFMTPFFSSSNLAGPMIADDRGRPVWMVPVPAGDLEVQRYRGEPVLTYFTGAVVPIPGFGAGAYVVVNESYLPVATIRPSGGLENADLHELEITPQDTALLGIYRPFPADLVSVGLGPDSVLLDSVIQEVEIPTNRVLFEWRASEHVPVSASHREPTPGAPYDFFHLNSIEVDTDDNLLVSARHTSTIYKIDRDSGDILWQLGGKNSDFTVDPDARFASQHDARRRPDGTISLFDNAAGGGLQTAEESRGLVLDVDEAARTATLAREFTRPEGLLSTSQGNHQVLPNGNSLVAFGGTPTFTEFARDGEVVYDASFANPDVFSYRTYRREWVGRPNEPPIAVARLDLGSGMTVYASWNGATEVDRWRVLAGPTTDGLSTVGEAPRDGFETAIPTSSTALLVAAQALAEDGSVLATSVPAAPVPFPR